MMPRTACLAMIVLFSVSAVADAVSAAADAPSPPSKILGVRVGFGGRYKVGVWTPVEVRHHQATRVSIVVPDGDGVPSRFINPNPSGDTTLLYVRFGRVNSQMIVELDRAESAGEGAALIETVREVFASNDRVLGQSYRPAIPATRQMIVSVAAEPLGVQDAVGLVRQDEDERAVTVHLKDCRQLPDRWYGYEAVDTLVLSTSRPEIFRSLKPDSPQIVALKRWVQMGGKLVLCVGARGQEILSEDAPLRRFVPGKFQGMTVLRQTRAWERYAGSSRAVPEPPPSADSGGGSLELRVPRLFDVQGRILAQEADLPLVVRTPQGFGQIFFLAADLDQGPLSRWADRPLLLAKLLDLPTAGSDESEDRSAVMHYGYHDLGGQLRSALDQFSEVRRVPFWAVAVLVVVYIALIGPGDYFFLRKVTRRMQWTWVTFPAVVLLFSIGAYVLVCWSKGDQVRFNQVDLVDVDTASGHVRGTSWLGVFSPRTEPFNLSLQPYLPGGRNPSGESVAGDAEVLLSWLGLPGEALGGMNPRTSNPLLWTEQYSFSPQLDEIQGVPIPVRSTKSFTARWSTQAEVRLDAELVHDGLTLSGKITSRLGFPLSGCVLAHDRYAYELGTLGPGPDKSARIDLHTQRKELKTWLTERKFISGGKLGSYYHETTPYRQASVDVPYILRAMMFYEAAGGRRYTGLFHGYQGFVDLSSLLGTGRAILVGQGPPGHRGAQLLRNGRPMTEQEDRHTTIYRFVIPVKIVGN